MMDSLKRKLKERSETIGNLEIELCNCRLYRKQSEDPIEWAWWDLHVKDLDAEIHRLKTEEVY